MKSTTILTFFASTLFLVVPIGWSTGSRAQRVDQKKCPTIEIKGPKKSKAFNPFVYRATVKDFPRGTQPIFKWSLIGARIIEGQGTDVIRVRPVGLHVTATLTLENAPAWCESNRYSLATEMTGVRWIEPWVIDSVEVSPTSIVRPCSSGTRSDTCSTTSDQVQVTVHAGAPDEAEALITWEATAGRVIGKGEKVKWDLSEVAKGTYTITANVEYSFAGWTDGHLMSGSASVTISDCGDCKPVPTMDAAKPSSHPSLRRVTSHARLHSANTLR